MILVDHQLKKVLPQILVGATEEQIGPNSVDLRLSKSFRKFTYSDMMPVSNYVYDPKETEQQFYWKLIEQPSIILEPGEFILASTLERFNMPANLYAEVKGKSTIARTGLSIEFAGFVDSGFSGNITLEIKNNLSCKYKLYAGQLIAQVKFHVCEQVETSYAKDNKHTYNNQSGPTVANTKKLYRFLG